MVRSITLSSFALWAALSLGAVAEVDFTPHDSFYLAEATKIPNITFHNGKDEVSYSPPDNWKLSGGGNRLTLTPLDKPQAGAIMETAPAKDPLPATDENVKAYTEVALARLPREASKVTVVDSGIASVHISKRAMVEVTVTYSVYGQPFTSNILFMPHDKEQLVFQMTARTADYAPLARMFRGSLFSMQGL